MNEKELKKNTELKKKLTERDLELVNGGVGQDNYGRTDETDEPMGLCPTQASFEKWVKD